MKQPWRLTLSGALLLGTLLVLESRSLGEAIPIVKPLTAFPSGVGEWRGEKATIFEAQVLDVLKVSDYLMRRYADEAGRSLWLYVGYWEAQRRGAQIHSPKNCLPGSGWEPLERSRVEIPVSTPPGRILVNRYLIQKDQEQQLVFYWYQYRRRAIPDEVGARLEMVRNSILHNRTDGALVRVNGPVHDGLPATSDRLERFIQALYPLVSEHLPD